VVGFSGVFSFQQIGRYSVGERRRHSVAARGNSTLCDCTWRVQHLQGEVQENISEVWEKSAAADFAGPKQ